MEYSEMLNIVQRAPVFETGLLLSGSVNAFNVRKQLSRWTASHKLIQLRRGLYALAPPYQKTIPHPFLIANHLLSGSYISLQSALSYYGMIPENVPVVTSVSTIRPQQYETPLGYYLYRHIRTDWFHSYQRIEVTKDQYAFIASPEKALLDMIYLQPGGDDEKYLHTLRLQNLQQLNQVNLLRLAASTGKPKLKRAADIILQLISEEEEGYSEL